jgi:diguanylate cyclase (GGDEF)-like protein
VLHHIARVLRLTQFIALMLVLGLGGTLYHFLVQFEKADERVAHTNEVLREIEKTRLNSLRAGTWLRNFGIYPSPRYLERVHSSAAEAMQSAQRLKALTADSPQENARARALEAALTEVLDIYLTSADIATQLGAASLKEMTVAQVTRDITALLRTQLDAFEAEQRALLRSQSETETQRLTRFKRLLIAAGVLFTVAMLWSMKYSGQLLRMNEEQVGKLHTHASRDPLTGLLNRRGLDDFLEQLVGTSGLAKDVALLVFDLDDFKPVNDQHGHGAGDQVLTKVAQRLKRHCRGDDAIARVGGDEFVVVMPSVSTCDEATRIAWWIRMQLAQPVQLEAATVCIDASIGVAMLHEKHADVAAALRAADARMYMAKKAGKGRVHTGEPATV